MDFLDAVLETKNSKVDSKLIRNIVPIDKWINDTYYTGESGKLLYPFWKEHIIKIFSRPLDKRINEIILTGSIGGGKCLRNSQILPTPDGDKQMGSLRVGDFVYGSYGQPTKILGVYPQGVKQFYRCYFTDKSYLDVSEDHLWGVIYNRPGSSRNGDYITLSTKELMQQKSWQRYNFPMTPIVGGSDAPIDPYLLGLYLSDGQTEYSSSIRISKKDPLVTPYLDKECDYTRSYDVTQFIWKRGNRFCDFVLKYLSDCKSRDKFIPNECFQWSYKDRLSLLQGLMDGDGSIEDKGHGWVYTYYSSTSEQLIRDVQRLVASLGGKCWYRYRKHPRCDWYVATINTSFNPFRFTYQDVEVAPFFNYRKLKKIEYVGEEEATCIRVDDPLSLYIGCTQFNILTHNTTFMTFCFLRLLYELSCYANPHALYGLMPGTTIMLAYLSLNREIAEATGYGDLRSLLDSVPYFKEHFPRNYRLSNEIDWPDKNIKVTSGSRISHVIGTNLIGAALDEANFSGSGEATENSVTSISKAQNTYSSLRIRGEQRFSLGGIDYSLSILISSATTANSFTEARLQSSKNNPHVYHINSVAYEVAPWKYSEEKFPVFIGNDQLDPCICDNIAAFNNILDSLHLPRIKTDDSNIDVKELIKQLDENGQSLFRLVPVNFLESFKTDIIKGLQDVCGVSVNSVGRLFSARRYYNACIDPDLSHPFIQENFVLSTGSEVKGIEFLRSDWKPRHPEKLRYCAVDMALTGDSCGVAMCHIADMKEINGAQKPIIEVDFVLEIKPPLPPEKIHISKVREMVMDICNKFRLRIGKWTYDTFGSAESIQELQQQGINAEAQSVDRTIDPYLAFCDLFYEGRIRLYSYPKFEQEFFNLIYYRTKQKIDHPVDGSKDTSDALASSCFSAINADSVSDALRKKDMSHILDWL